jgi:hypothetical protein
MPTKTLLIAIAIALVSPAKSEAEPRKLTLAEAVQMALHIDPLISEAHITDERARLGVLRPSPAFPAVATPIRWRRCAGSS